MTVKYPFYERFSYTCVPRGRVKVFDEPNHYDCYRCNEDLDIEDYEVF